MQTSELRDDTPQHVICGETFPHQELMVQSSHTLKSFPGLSRIILLELTVPWEDRIEEAKERKGAKYVELEEECWNNGWRARCEPIEVGCRGFAGQSLCRAYNILGITGASKRRAIKEVTEAAEVASRWLWLRRGEPWAR
ncbi:hypothetical protein DPEC_G00017320 [Dallia pectoralis]|uniref:Uncharacterized protein n=1 Tax=Dallia pectoralis TaxID=75939 RepID=A0ACC2HFZ7_DALPE|nr:hypothetical protein DPEC_G00017320 [Dallia pectoralis]